MNVHQQLLMPSAVEYYFFDRVSLVFGAAEPTTTSIITYMTTKISR